MQLPLRRASAHLFDFNCSPLRRDNSLPDGTDSLSDKRKVQLFAVVYNDRSTTYIWHIKMSCGQTTTISTGDGRPDQPSTHRCPARGIRRDAIMVARGIPEVEDDSSGGENHSCGSRARRRASPHGPAQAREVVDTIRYRVRDGTSWREVTASFGSW